MIGVQPALFTHIQAQYPNTMEASHSPAATVRMTRRYIQAMAHYSWLLVGTLSLSAAAAVPVTTETLHRLAVFPQSSAPATVISRNDSKLSAQVTAAITTLPVRVGDQVEAGTVLVTMEDTDYQLALQQAEATLSSLRARHTLAKAQLDRVSKLARSKSASVDLLNQRQAEVRQLSAEIGAQKATIQIARQDLQRCQLRAPFDALVLERQAQLGELATPGKVLIRVLEANQLEVEARIQPNDVAAVQEAASLFFKSQGRNFPVTIRMVVPALDERDRSRRMRLAFSAEAALPYSAGLLTWRHRQPHIPPHLLVRRNGQLGVMTSNGAEAEFVALPEASEGQPVATTLPMDTAIIIDGRFRVQQGDTLLLDE